MGLMPIDHHVPSHINASVHLEMKASCIHIARDSLSTYALEVIASIIKIPPTEPPEPSDTTFDNLACTLEDVQNISRLISVMGENGKVVLLFKYQRELRQIGRKIEHVHPLKFISVVISDPHLRSCMKQIHSDYFKWSNLMDGLGNGLSSQNMQGKVSIFLNDFAKAVNVAPESLQKFVDREDWENMLIFLINQ
jgi:hypothetical protein